MSTAFHDHDARELLSRTARMRVLARRLVKDASAADDLVQTALVHALEHGGVAVREPGDAWYTVVLRNLSRDRARGDGRRRAREETAARPEALPETLEAVANAECQRDVADAVLQLDEPYRTAVLLRFFEELPPREIAKRTGQSSETVGKQVTRGLAQLRAKLEARHGDRGAWAVALLPLAGREAVSVSAVGVGALSLGSLWRAAAVLFVLLGAVFGVRALVERSGSQVERPVDLAQRAAAPPAELPEPAAPPRVERRATVVVPETEVDAHAATTELMASDVRTALGDFVPEVLPARVVDLNGDPVEGVQLRWGDVPSEPRSRSFLGGFIRVTEPDQSVTVRTDSDGRFTSLLIPSTHDLSSYTCLDEGWIVLDGGEDAEGLLHIVLAPAVRLAGRTIGTDGLPVAGARVSVEAKLAAVASFPLRLRSFDYLPPKADVTDAVGAFDLGRVPAHPDFRIHVIRPGDTASNTFGAPARDDLGLELELRDPSDHKKITLVGMVSGPTGVVTAGLAVRFGQDQAMTDTLGHFELEVSSWYQGAFFSVRGPDGRFVVLDVPGRATVLEEGDFGPYVLRLPARMSRLMGQVVDHELKPAAGFEVFLVDGTRIGSTLETYESRAARSSVFDGLKTDSRGCFVFPSVADRPYRVRVLDRKTMAVQDVTRVVPGDGFLRIVLDADRLVEEITGTVVDHFRRPVVGARVSITATTFSPLSSGTSVVGRAVLTDHDGVFRITDAPWRGVKLSVDARPDDYRGGQTFDLGDHPPVEPFEFVLDLICEVNAILDGEPEVTRLELLDVEGERIHVIEITSGPTMYRVGPVRHDNGRFPLFEVSQRAVTVVLLADKTELRRMPIHLDATKRNMIRL